MITHRLKVIDVTLFIKKEYIYGCDEDYLATQEWESLLTGEFVCCPIR